MTPRGRGGRGLGPGEQGRVLEVEDSTVFRAGESATRVALEETLLRKGWRVLWFEDTVGPLEGADRARLLDGVAVRLRPGEDEALEFRLLRVQSGTTEIPEGAVDRMQRVTDSLEASWLLAAFDGEQMRLVPDPDGDRVEPARAPSRGERQPSRGQPPPERGRSQQREPPRGEPAPPEHSPGGRPRRRGGARPRPASEHAPSQASQGRPQEPSAAQRTGPSNGRRRGRRGGRGRRR